ncbi:hypothetical protein [Methylovulum psychrotolerans]|uniref:Uncharacterized protein n=1 Tax=Methylovulum psychrotolerans TaxID=1704499 RepID=A0A1Z4C2P0_9GAMM|nr:hypothetical protein [Methylovulum psychrotolerans]ASF47807.1 hypothetical protein CEK71_18015 [Methylovulum psychrotolerans]
MAWLYIDLSVLSDGKIDTTNAKVTIGLSPNLPANTFIPGTYIDGQGATCTVVTTVLQGGRTEAALSCSGDFGYTFQANWVTGIILGHPYELDLRAAGIDKLSSYTNYSWGKVANSSYGWWGCMDANDIVSARQIGNTLAIGGYNTANLKKCGVNLTKK